MPQPPKVSTHDTTGDLIEHWQGIIDQIARIEARYPFLTTTLVTVLVGVAAANSTQWFQSLRLVAPYLVPVVVLLGVSYVLGLFRRVAILQGYAAFLEDEINSRRGDQAYLLNSRYIDKFEQNNGPNRLMQVMNVVMLAACVGAGALLIDVHHLWGWFRPWYNISFCVAVFVLLVLIGWAFIQNDNVRHGARKFAHDVNHPQQSPHP